MPLKNIASSYGHAVYSLSGDAIPR